METKICKQCKNEKELTEYSYHDAKLKTYRAQCKVCYAANRKEKRENNLEHHKQQQKKCYEKYKIKYIENIKLYQENNKDKVKN